MQASPERKEEPFMSTSTALQAVPSGRMERSTSFSFAPQTFNEAIQFAERLAQSELVPKNFRGKPQDILVALQMGAEVNLPPMQALKSIAVINGMPSLYGPGFLAVIMGHPAFEWIKEDDLETITKNGAATCIIKRRGAEPHKTTFTKEMAKKAGLLGKAGPWVQYESRMMQMRARGFCGNDTFPDALRGIVLYEEAADYDTSIDSQPEQPKIAATITIPAKAEVVNTPAQVAADKPAESNTGQQGEVAPATITIPQAKAYYIAYSASGYLPEESKSWLKEKYGITDSRLIKPEDYGDCMAWANTPKVAEQPLEEWTGTLEENMDAEPA